MDFHSFSKVYPLRTHGFSLECIQFKQGRFLLFLCCFSKRAKSHVLWKLAEALRKLQTSSHFAEGCGRVFAEAFFLVICYFS